jgi:hypothetical protein
MNSITCPKDGCETDDFAGVQAIKGHINAKRDHNYSRLWPKVEQQIETDEEDDRPDDQDDDEQQSTDEGTDSDSDSTEESMPSDAELKTQRQKAKKDQGDDQGDQGDDQGSQGATGPSLPSPSVPLSTKSLLLVGGTVAAGLLLYWLLTRDDQEPDQPAPTPEQEEQPDPEAPPAQRGIIPEGNNV